MQIVNVEGKKFKMAVKSAVREALESLIDKEEGAPIVVSDRFTILPDGWIRDKKFGIEWGPSSSKRMNFSDAEKYCVSVGGRLPTSKELMSLIDHGRREPATVEPFVKNTKTDDWYWSGTRCQWNSSCAWCVGFYGGSVGNGSEDGEYYVRPVRSSQYDS